MIFSGNDHPPAANGTADGHLFQGQQMAKTEARSNVMSARHLALFAVPFVIAGLGFGGCGARTAWQHIRAPEWVETPAVIRSVDIKEHRGKSGSSTHQTVATYEYEFDGRRYTGDRVSFHVGADSVGGFQREVHRELSSHLASGKPFRCFVNPRNPAESVLYRNARWEMMLMICGVAALFGSGGICLGNEALRASRKERATSGREVSPDSPWMIRSDWAAGRIRTSDDRNMVRFAAILAAWWVIATLPLAILLPSLFANAISRWVWLTLIPLTIALLAMLGAAYIFLRRRRYGEPEFQMKSVPGVVGGSLAGEVHIPTRVASDGGFQAKLVCMSQTHTSRGKEHETSLWQTERHIPASEISAKTGATTVPVRFAIPAHVRSTSLPGDDAEIRWLLVLSSRLAGIDFKTEFEVPVFKTADGAEDFIPVEHGTQQLPPRDVEQLYRQAGVVRTPLPTGGVRFKFGMLRNPVSAIITTVIATVLVVGTWLLIGAEVLFIAPAVVGFLALCFTPIALSLWLDRSVVEASPQGLTVRGGWLGLGKKHAYRPEEIKRFSLKQTMASGKHVWNTIYVEPRSGKRRKIASSIGSRLVEQALIEDLNRALKRDNDAA
jgi:hypothetical protein